MTPGQNTQASRESDVSKNRNPAIEISDVTVTYKTKRMQNTALQDVSLEVPEGAFLSIVGPSGCGKSTLLKLISGLVRPTSGSVKLRNQKVDGPRQDIGYVFQQPALLPWRTVLQNMLLQAEMRDMDMESATRRAHELIEMAGLKGFADALPKELSGGMQQRVALCRGLLHEPPVLLMDEPFGALDALTREQMNMEMNQIWRRTKTTVAMVTHSIAEGVFLGTRVVVCSPRPGRIIESIDVDLPTERNYADVMSHQAFVSATKRVRELLTGGDGGHHD